MIREGGAALVLGAWGYLGWRRMRWYSCRTDALWDLALGLERLAGELEDRTGELPDLLERLSAEESWSGRLFGCCRAQLERLGEQPLARLWEDGVRGAQLPLSREEGEVLLRLGAVLGRYDRERQRDAVDRTAQTFRTWAEQAAREHREQGKLSVMLCAAAGAVLVLMLY